MLAEWVPATACLAAAIRPATIHSTDAAAASCVSIFRRIEAAVTASPTT